MVCSGLSVAGVAARAAVPDKSPDDVYGQAMILTGLVKELRRSAGVDEPWPLVPPQSGKASRHVLQKSLEVLKKVNRLRVIRKMGAVSIPPFPSRRITPNEVYSMVERLVGEMRALAPNAPIEPVAETKGMTPSGIYRRMWAVSRAIDPVLGVRGFTPNDVFAQSARIVQLVRFLRQTQNLTGEVEKPQRPSNKHPNHAIAAAYQLLERISLTQGNLWMESAQAPEVPNPVVTPTDVYDALQIVIAELQRIKYRLGVRRYIPEPPPATDKTPDDVIQQLNWAARLMPDFALDRPLYQYNLAVLVRTPGDTFTVSEHILRELTLLKAIRGNPLKPLVPPPVGGLQAKHVYQKTLENLKKVNLLRRQAGLGDIVLPTHPQQSITPDEVYDLAVRLDAELEIIYSAHRVPGTLSIINEITEETADNKTEDDVYFNMWRISYLLDSILGTGGFSLADVYREAQGVVAEIRLISQHLKRWKGRLIPPMETGYMIGDMFNNAEKVLNQIALAQKRAGAFGKQPPLPRHGKDATANDVHNLMEVIKAELISLKTHMGIAERPVLPPETTKTRTVDHIHQMLSYAHILLSDLLVADLPQGPRPGQRR